MKNLTASKVVCSSCSKPIERANQRVYAVSMRGTWALAKTGLPQHRVCP